VARRSCADRYTGLAKRAAADERGFGLNAFFVMMFVGSAMLFRKAGESAPGAV
jgi:hypothetical protein